MTNSNDYKYLDDVASGIIVGTVLFAILSAIGAFIYFIATGEIGTDITITGNIAINGTIPVGYILMGVLGFIFWMVYVAFTDIYGAKRIEQATQRLEDLRDE